ncbi:MAG: DUF4190 domain-containing protein [Lachnospiraceae bacterium]|nr:DUF4190 domain-containing protein [Lachnospiraceae bacterium]
MGYNDGYQNNQAYQNDQRYQNNQGFQNNQAYRNYPVANQGNNNFQNNYQNNYPQQGGYADPMGYNGQQGMYADQQGMYQDEQEYPINKPGTGITSMIFGICSVSLWEVPFITSIPCIVFGIIALVLQKKRWITNPRFHGFYKAGKVTGIIGIIIASIYTLIYIFAVGALATTLRRWY